MILRSARRFLFLVGLVLIVRGADAPPAPLILISMDGFRWDYCDLHPAETSNLRQMKRDGVSARGLIPVFPSNTFPNHYTIVTGLYPAHHGIINNHMFDPRTGEFFHYNVPQSARDPQWWDGEPIWITAVKQGRKSTCFYWPGSEAEIQGRHATSWRPYDYFTVDFATRLSWLVNCFSGPRADWPAVTTFYIEEGNAIGHDFGPDSPEMVAQLKTIDGQIGEIRAAISRLGVAANLVIVSDHGMTAVSDARRLILDDVIDVTTVQVDDSGSVVALRPLRGSVEALEEALHKLPHVAVYRAEALPARFHLSGNSRIAPLWVLPDEGWRLETRASAAKPRRSGQPLRGDHGYDPALQAMHGVFIAAGPAFKRDVQIPEVENIHLYNLLCAAAGLKPAANDGDDRLVRAALKN